MTFSELKPRKTKSKPPSSKLKGTRTGKRYFVPKNTQSHKKTKSSTGTKFSVVQVESQEEEDDFERPQEPIYEGEGEYGDEMYEEREDLTHGRTTYMEDKSWYFTSGQFYLGEMTDRVERHHKETVRSQNKIEFVKPYLNKVHGSYYTGNAKQRAYYDPKTIGNQEFIDRAYYDVVCRGYLRNRKRLRTSYPIYGENLHPERSQNRVILHFNKNTTRGGRDMYASTRRLEVVES